jgi:hypothetical protein
MHIRERQFGYIDENPNSPTFGQTIEDYANVQGENYTVERLMPSPYNITFSADIWSTNTDQKLQILEQILVLFRPAMEIQTTSNYIDWTSLSYVELTGVNWSSRQIPQGTENDIDIATLTFEMPIWLSAPAKVKRLGVIQKVINSMYDEQGAFSDDSLLINLAARRYVTPLDYGIFYSGNQLKLLKPHEIAIDNKAIITIKEVEKYFQPSYAMNVYKVQGQSIKSYHWDERDSFFLIQSPLRNIMGYVMLNISLFVVSATECLF